MKIQLLILASVVASAACSEGRAGGSDQEAGQPQVMTTGGRSMSAVPADVQNTVAEVRLAYSGKVHARRYADLSFEIALPVKAVLVKNGQRVRKGQWIAELDGFKLDNALEQAERHLEQARLEMKDVIISQGYDPDKPAMIPADVTKLAEVKSGFSLYNSQLDAARHELGMCVVAAPFDGVVANLSLQPFALSQPGQPFCRIVDMSDMEVVFSVMERDLGIVGIGTEVMVRAFAVDGDVFAGRVTEINPIVDASGTVTVKAGIDGDLKLFDGMNVEIQVK